MTITDRGASVLAVSHAHRLLVATPLIGEPTFERTVVLVVSHDGDGAFGVVINRPSDVAVADVIPAWADDISAPGVVFLGGPCDTQRVLGLGRTGGHPSAPPPVEGRQALVGGYGTVDLNSPPPLVSSGFSGVRLFAGSAGWAPGQLEDEIADGAWWLCDAEADDVVTADPSGLWRRVLRRQHGETAWFANHPSDPSMN